MSARPAPPDPIQQLQHAACYAAKAINPDSRAGRVVVFAADGSRLIDLHVPACAPAPSAVTPASPAVASGWSLADGSASFDGRAVPVGGRKLDVLRVLVESEVATLDDLRAAWAGYAAEESTVRWTVGELKKVLAKLFPDLPEPIKATGSGYTLLVR